MILKHSKLMKCQMLDWIKEQLAQGLPAPTDDEIVDRFVLSGAESARVLLATLADEGAITIDWKTPGRPIALGRDKRRLIKTGPVIPSITKRDESVEDGVSKIISIVGRGKAPTGVSTTADTSLRNDLGPPPVQDPNLRVRVPPRAPLQQPSGRRLQINARIERGVYVIAQARAKERRVSLSALCGDIVTEALTASSTVDRPLAKPRIPAPVMAAYIADGRDLRTFIEHILLLGLAKHQDRTASADG